MEHLEFETLFQMHLNRWNLIVELRLKKSGVQFDPFVICIEYKLLFQRFRNMYSMYYFGLVVDKCKSV